jgi:hypothetical protein
MVTLPSKREVTDPLTTPVHRSTTFANNPDKDYGIIRNGLKKLMWLVWAFLTPKFLTADTVTQTTNP